ncbi:MAG: 7-carboxy-7-deazaguanine synthase QueE [Bryobacteraceae bacterium]|nr:7-carboxy-7-deazaguanine synthase QueE [Bryobacteraceae bacterium]
MKISEIFYSIQGEGMLVGTPSVFVRTSGCNLRCHWCDTPYASWKPEGEDLYLGAILAEVRRYWADYVVITGGEPMIVKDMVRFTQQLKTLGFHITVETAGTVFEPVDCDLLSISPKLSNSTPTTVEGGRWAAQHERLRIQPEVLKKLIGAYPYQLKFVVEKPDDIAEIRSLVNDLDADRRRIVLMAEGTDPETLHERSLWLADICREEKYRFTPRLHIDLYGNRRGV